MNSATKLVTHGQKHTSRIHAVILCHLESSGSMESAWEITGLQKGIRSPEKRSDKRRVRPGIRQWSQPCLLTTVTCCLSNRVCACVHTCPWCQSSRVYGTVFRKRSSQGSCRSLKHFYSYIIKMILWKKKLVSCKQANNQNNKTILKK